MKKTFLVILVLFCTNSWLNAIVINVPADYETIQAGLDVAVEGDSVLVADGIYYENIDWPDVNGISLIGSSEENCIIDGNYLASVIRFEEDLEGIIDTTTLIAGFTIQNGRAYGDDVYKHGGGIFCSDSSPSLVNVTINDNSAFYDGGGIYCENNSNLSIEHVIISNNWGIDEGSGGGIYCENSDVSLRYTIVENNHAGYWNGGGGIYCKYSSMVLENVQIINNIYYGGSGDGIYCKYSDLCLENVEINNNSGDGLFCNESDLNLENVEINNNSGRGISFVNSTSSLLNVNISNNSANDYGGGLSFVNSTSGLLNVNINNNSADDYGGGLFCEDSNLDLENVSIVNNTAENHNGGMHCIESRILFSNENRCNIYSNTTSNNRDSGIDIFAFNCLTIDVYLDTFTVITPSEHYAYPIDNINFDILNSVEENNLIDADLFVAVEGDDTNSGTSPNDPFKTIGHALEMLFNNNLNINTIYLAEGIYSPSTNGEVFPLVWSNYVNLIGAGEELSVLDAENSA
ncbi:MAG: hypothetical protein HN334_06935, partial [Candidatus Cloacimonetes bacterium]|nr:hypothetical protein [Candidatus Cloacimonadota bacterium]